MNIREVERADSAHWLSMRCALWPGSTDQHGSAIDAFLDGTPGLLWKVLVCESNFGELVGFIELSIRNYAEGSRNNRVPYIEGWYVDPQHRQGGIGAQLVRKAELLALDAGFTELASDAETNNAVSISAHTAMGFEEVERTVHFLKKITR